MLLEDSECLTYLSFNPMAPVSWSSEYPWMGLTCPGFILKRVTDLKGLHMCKKLYCRVYRLPIEDSCYVIIILCIHTWIILLHVPTWTYTLLHILLLLLSCFSCVWLFVTPWSVARQAPLSMGFSSWELLASNCSNLPCPPPGDLPDPGIEPWSLMSTAFAGRFWRRKWQPSPVFCLENPMDRGAWRATVHGITKSRTRLSDFHFHFFTTKATCHYYILTHTHYLHICFTIA